MKTPRAVRPGVFFVTVEITGKQHARLVSWHWTGAVTTKAGNWRQRVSSVCLTGFLTTGSATMNVREEMSHDVVLKPPLRPNPH